MTKLLVFMGFISFYLIGCSDTESVDETANETFGNEEVVVDREKIVFTKGVRDGIVEGKRGNILDIGGITRGSSHVNVFHEGTAIDKVPVEDNGYFEYYTEEFNEEVNLIFTTNPNIEVGDTFEEDKAENAIEISYSPFTGLSTDEEMFDYMDEVLSKHFNPETIYVGKVVDDKVIIIRPDEDYSNSYVELFYHIKFGNQKYIDIWPAFVNRIIEASEELTDSFGPYTIRVDSPLGDGTIFSVTNGDIQIDEFGVENTSLNESSVTFYEAKMNPEFPDFDNRDDAYQHLQNKYMSDEMWVITTEEDSTIIFQPLGDTRDHMVELNEALKVSDERYEEWLKYEVEFINASNFIFKNIKTTGTLVIAPDLFNQDGTINMDKVFEERLANYSYGRTNFSPFIRKND